MPQMATAADGLDENAKKALEEGTVHTVFETQQPLTEEGHIVGFESLVRGKTPEGEEVRPDQLVVAAVATGQLREMHMIVVEDSLRLANKTGKPVSVNMHPKLLREDGIVEEMDAAREKANVDRSQLSIEILETASKSDIRKKNGGKKTLEKLTGARPLDTGETIAIAVAADDYPEKHSSKVYRSIQKCLRRKKSRDEHITGEQLDNQQGGAILKVDFHTVHNLFSPYDNEKQKAEERVRQAAKLARKGAKLVIEGIEPGQMELRRHIEELVEGILSTERILVQVGRPESAETMQKILAGEEKIRAHGQ